MFLFDFILVTVLVIVIVVTGGREINQDEIVTETKKKAKEPSDKKRHTHSRR
jgi:hypothetical protein